MFQPTVLLLLILVSVLCGSSGSLFNRSSNEIFLPNFRGGDLSKLANYARVRIIVFKNAEIPFASLEMLDQLKECRFLVFQHGIVKRIQMKPSLTSLTVERTKTEEVLIDLGNNYGLTMLSITQCYLTRIPENINELKELEFLHLSNNRIDYVTMDNFKGMKKLKRLDLAYNQIKHVLTVDEFIILPKLEQLMINYNQLYELDVCSWLMTNLVSLNLGSNDLTYIIGLSTNNFPVIKLLDLDNNPLNCRWKDRFEKYAEDRSLSLSSYVDCDDSHQEVVPSSCKVLSAMNSKFKAWRNVDLAKSGAMTGNADTKLPKLSNNQAIPKIQNEELNSKLEMMEQKLIKQMAEQRNMIDDLVETIYRIEIERLYKPTLKQG